MELFNQYVDTMTPLERKLKINTAAQNGDAAHIEQLLLGAKKGETYFHALENAAENGHLECVRLILPFCPSKMKVTQALEKAAGAGHASCVSELIAHSAPKASESLALRRAVVSGNLKCVELLIPVSDPKAMRSQALLEAVRCKQRDIFATLYAVSNVKDAESFFVNIWSTSNENLKDFQQWSVEEEAVVQAQRLNDEIHSHLQPTSSGMKRKI